MQQLFLKRRQQVARHREAGALAMIVESNNRIVNNTTEPYSFEKREQQKAELEPFIKTGFAGNVGEGLVNGVRWRHDEEKQVRKVRRLIHGVDEFTQSRIETNICVTVQTSEYHHRSLIKQQRQNQTPNQPLMVRGEAKEAHVIQRYGKERISAQERNYFGVA